MITVNIFEKDSPWPNNRIYNVGLCRLYNLIKYKTRININNMIKNKLAILKQVVAENIIKNHYDLWLLFFFRRPLILHEALN